MAPLPAVSERDRMAAYNDKEPVVPKYLNAVPPSDGLSVVNKQTYQISNNSSASSQNGLTESERPQASLQSSIEPQSLHHHSILDLADELLINIFGYAKGGADIRNIRLTCRRFCGTSSHLLLDCLDVCLTAASLDRTQEISCHPALSKGIRGLHISLQAHNYLENASSFTSLAIQHLRENINLVLRNPQISLGNGSLASSAEFQLILKKRQRLLDSWCQYRDTQECSTQQQSLDVEVLYRGYEKYRMAYEWQQRTLQDGTFAQAIAATMGRIPKTTKLFFTNRLRYRGKPPRFHANLWKNHTSASDIFDDLMVLSIGASSLGSEVEPTELAVQLPLAIHAAGFPAVEMGIQRVSRFGTSGQSTWIQDQAQLLGLKAAAKNLQVFTFEGRITSLRRPEDICSASTYLRVVLTAANLRVLTLSLPFSCLHDEKIGSLLASVHWPHLREINLAHVPFHLNELETFVDRFQPGILIDLKLVHLRSGSWAEGLDVLRSKASPESQVGSLSGAECESWNTNRLRRIIDGGQMSQVSQYIQGASICNPFRVPWDGTIYEERGCSVM